MVEVVTMLLVFTALAASSSSVYPSPDDVLAAAIDEMRSAGYFSFVMLLRISPPNLIRDNITFLLPDDKTLSNNRLPVHGIPDFLLRHTIPSPLLFDYLQHIPTGSALPTLEPEYMVNINNQGRTSFFLNNVRVSNPNVCVMGSSIRCHGIDDVLPISVVSPSTHCSNVSTGTGEPESAARLPSPPSPTDPTFAALPLENPSNHHQGSGARPRCSSRGVLRYLPAFAFGALWLAGFIHVEILWATVSSS